MALETTFATTLAAAQAGAEWALASLYRELQPALLRYLRAKEPREAEDLASETWLDVAAGLGRFVGDEDGFRRFVFTIARRRLADLGRRAARRPAAAPDEPLRDVPCDRDTESEAWESMAVRAAIARVAALPPDQAEVVLLRVLAGLSAEDVGAMLGKSQGAVRVLQHRALRRLAADLDREAVTR